MTKTVLLIARHGNTFGPDDIIRRVGRKTDISLVESGREQGRKLGNYLKQHNLIPTVIITSPLKRCKQTVDQIKEILNLDPELIENPLLMEIDYGPDENKAEEEVVKRLGPLAIQKWDEDGIVPDGWSIDVHQTIKDWKYISNLIEEDYSGKIILVVTSNGIARFAPYLTGDFEGFRKKHAIKISTGALCIFEKESSEENWHCVNWNIKP